VAIPIGRAGRTHYVEPVDLDALSADADAKLAELRPQLARLSLDALTDPTVAAELADVQSEIASAESALAQVALARQEQGRRDSQAAAEAEAQRRAEALDSACVIQVEREAAAASFDAAADALAAATWRWLRACDRQDVALREAGRTSGSGAARARPFALQGAYQRAMRDTRGVLALEATVPPREQKRLADADVRPVEPKMTTEKGRQ